MYGRTLNGFVAFSECFVLESGESNDQFLFTATLNSRALSIFSLECIRARGIPSSSSVVVIPSHLLFYCELPIFSRLCRKSKSIGTDYVLIDLCKKWQNTSKSKSTKYRICCDKYKTKVRIETKPVLLQSELKTTKTFQEYDNNSIDLKPTIQGIIFNYSVCVCVTVTPIEFMKLCFTPILQLLWVFWAIDV